ncbi:MAG: cobaltochelatase subunit CobN [Bacteroides sp.]
MKKKVFLLLGLVVLVVLGVVLWLCLRPRPIRVAAVNMPDFMLSRMVLSADKLNADVRPEDDLTRLSKYDAVLVFGMGLKWTEDDRDIIRALDEKGVKYTTMMVTTPENNLTNMDSVAQKTLLRYIMNGGTSNYRSAFNYLRRDVVGKPLRTGEVAEPIRYGDDLLFARDSEDKAFYSIREYEEYYKAHGYREGAPRVAVITGIAGPFNSNREYLDELYDGLTAQGFNIYQISSFGKRLEFLDSIQPDLVVYFPHGRLLSGRSDELIAWLKGRNIPVLAPITVGMTHDEWVADPNGLIGGFLSQSVVTPEIDGAILPYALVVMEERNDGLKIFRTAPERLATFCQLARNYVALKQKPNSEKRVAIYYYKGPGANSLVAQGIEVDNSLFNVLVHLKQAGYKVDGLPATAKEFNHLIMTQGALFNSYAEGAQSDFMRSGYPAFVPADSLQRWVDITLTPRQRDTLKSKYGPVPGEYLTYEQDGKLGIAVTRIQLGNVAILPQPAQGAGANDFKMVHGSVPVPAYPFIASYMWVRYAFGADVMMHFGTHGSLEFIPGKQVALSHEDYTDRMVNTLPHIYYYTTANIGEAIIAKRRSYAELVSYLAPPFISTELEAEVSAFLKLCEQYLGNEKDDDALSLRIKKIAVAKGYYRDLKLDSVLSKPYSRDEIDMLSDFVVELATAKIPGGMYRTGIPFSGEKIASSVRMLTVDPLAYGIAQLAKYRGQATAAQIKNDTYYAQHFLKPAEAQIRAIQSRPNVDLQAELQRAGVRANDLATEKAYLAMQAEKAKQSSGGMMGMGMGSMMGMPTAMGSMSGKMGGKSGGMMGGGHPSWIPKIGKRPEGAAGGHPTGDAKAKSNEEHPADTPKEGAKPEGMGGHPGGMPMGNSDSGKVDQKFLDSVQPLVEAIGMIREALVKVPYYKQALLESPQKELKGIENAYNGGYMAPSPGGDYIASPSVLPTGRNLYAIDPERTPTQKAWEHAKQLADDLIADYRKRHDGDYPRKVSFTLWSSSFIESEGTTVGEILYLLGVQPVRDRMGRVLDVELIPAEELGRPRIDVVVQTSGQLRDIAASRLFLIQKAVELAAEAPADAVENMVAKGVTDAERALLDQGLTPAQARELSTARVFGGVNGAYGTGIQEMVEAGDKWEDRSEIASVYLNNMGAIYGSKGAWGSFTEGTFRAALQNTDAVVQPRQSNTWGALSLDHVYEFMGGLTLAVHEVTGKDPEGYFSDLRNRNRVRTQEIKQAIGVEARTTILNPTYVKQMLAEGAGAAAAIDETVTNTYGWNVMKESVIDRELWEAIYDMYVADTQHLGTVEFFKRENPAALQNMTGTMLETVRKGMWKASPEVVANLAKMHTDLIKEFGAGCSGTVCNNAKLRDFIGQQVDAQTKADYEAKIDQVRNAAPSADSKAQVLKKDEQNSQVQTTEGSPWQKSLTWIIGGIVVIAAGLIVFARRRKREE